MSNIYVYSKAEFNQLSLNFLSDKAIIRIHNIKEQNWITDIPMENIINLYFDDINENQMFWYEKAYFYLPNSIQNKLKINFIKKNQALILLDFIKKNRNYDFIIHCEFGKSRSVAIAKFIENFYNGELKNKKKEECKNYNTLVFNLLRKLNNDKI